MPWPYHTQIAHNPACCRFGALGCQGLHLVRHHGRSLAGLPCAGGLDRGVERQKIRARRDIADQAHHVANAFRRYAQAADACIGCVGLDLNAMARGEELYRNGHLMRLADDRGEFFGFFASVNH